MPPGHRRLALILGALIALGPLGIDMYLPGFPAIAADLGATAAEVQGTVAAFLFGMAFGQLAYGPLADRLGRRIPMFIGLGLFAVASLACALSTSIEALTFLRFVQALGGCAGMVITRAIVRDLCDERGAVRMMSALMLAMGAAPILAPMFGSWLLAVADWRAIFWTMVLYAAVLLAVMVFMLPESLPPEGRRRDGPAQVLLVYLSILRDRRFLGRSLAGAMPMGGMFAYIAGSPFVVMELHGVGPTLYGLIFGANAAGLILVSQVNARLVRWRPPVQMLRAALLATAVAGGLVLLGALTDALGLFGILAPLFAYMALLGAVMPISSALAMAPMGRTAGMASALIGTMQFGFGALVGAALGALHDGTAVPMAALIALGGLGGLVAERVLVGRG